MELIETSIEAIALANEGWSWSGKEIQDHVKKYFCQMGFDLTALHESDPQFPAQIYEIVDRVIEQLDHEIGALIQLAATTKLPGHFQTCQFDIEQKTSMLCLSKAIMERIQQKIGCLDAAENCSVPSVNSNNTTDVTALQSTTRFSGQVGKCSLVH